MKSNNSIESTDNDRIKVRIRLIELYRNLKIAINTPFGNSPLELTDETRKMYDDMEQLIKSLKCVIEKECGGIDIDNCNE